MRYIWWTTVGIIVVFLSVIYIDLPGTNSFAGRSVSIIQGIDLAGGARLLLCAQKGAPHTSVDMDTAANVLRNRASGGYGVTEPQVNRLGSDCVSVELPGIKDVNKAIINIGATGFLALTDSGGQNIGQGVSVKLVCPPTTPNCAAGLGTGVTNLTANPPVMQVIVPGTYVSQGSAQVGADPNGAPQVTYTLTGKGSDDWCSFTTSHVGKFSAIVLDKKVVSDPVIQSAICGGQTVITGLNADQAKGISTDLNYGALPVPLCSDPKKCPGGSSQTVSASLGSQYVDEAKKAGIVAMIIVAIFMLLYYRLPGLLADLALIMYASTVFAAFKLIGVTLTLAGIAGFILSIGMAVDANVLIFERMKEELRGGKTLGAAVESGFRRAWPSIRDSNASTVITTVILFWFGHNFAATTITGFATTLFLGVVISMLTAVFVSHTFLRLLVLSGYARSPKYYGVEPPETPVGTFARGAGGGGNG
jgi:preprotein translocase subunit SecD